MNVKGKISSAWKFSDPKRPSSSSKEEPTFAFLSDTKSLPSPYHSRHSRPVLPTLAFDVDKMMETPTLSLAWKYASWRSFVAIVSSLCYFPFSEPIYFIYFLFFAPYIVKLLSFLCPLFFTTSLVLVSLVLEPDLVLFQAGECRWRSEEPELYRIIFETPEDDGVSGGEDRESVNKFLIHGANTSKEDVIFQGDDEFGEIKGAFHVEGHEVKQHGTLSKEVVIVSEGREVSNANAENWNKINLPMRQGSWKFSLSFDGTEVHGGMNRGIGSFGSMRKEKEWTRTLACKLLEERNNEKGGEEGMDLLWERYEDDSSRRKERRKKGDLVSKVAWSKLPKEQEGDDDADEDGNEGQMCCLQALKFSAGKMNLGIGRPNVLRISRALTRMACLQNVRRRKTE